MTIVAFILVGLVRWFFHDFLATAGSSVSRHTRDVLSKSLTASIFTGIMIAALLAIFSLFSAATAMTAVYAWPVLFVVEFGLRQLRSARVKADEAKYNERVNAKK